jgi:hypothetical protein
MRKILKIHFQRVLSLFALCVLCVAMFLGGQMTAPVAYADTAIGDVQMDSSNVMDDLQNSTIDGVKFDISNYAFDENQPVQVFMFAEYCYSFYTNLRGNYGLYVYVYNPRGLSFNLNSTRNTIQFRAGEQEHSAKYLLLYLNQCEVPNYEGLFIKFKVYMTAEQKADILANLNSAERVYDVTEIELVLADTGEVENYTVSTNYYYSGYAAGYGSDPNAENTLSIKSEQADTLSLVPHATAYRPEGTNGKNDYTQDSLHSVYFAVPNEFIEMYGEMSAVHARWLDAVLNPILVTGNQSAYNAISEYIGKDISADGTDLGYFYLGAHRTYTVAGLSTTGHSYGYSYNNPGFWSNNVTTHDYYGDTVNPLYYIFNSGDSTDSADNYTVSSEDLTAELKKSKDIFGGELVNDKYSRIIFESVAEEWTDKNIERETEYPLTSEIISQTWWEKLWGDSHVESSTTFDGIQAIYAVDTENDLQGTDDEVSQRLYISSGDVQDLKDFCTAPENEDCTIYLFRYQTTDYIAQEATLFEKGGMYGWTEKDTNAYFFQETVNLDFDIIDVTFSNGEVDTVIPVAMNPIDVVPAATPPVHTTSDVHASWWAYVILVVGEVLILWLLQILLHKLCGLPTWVMIILVAVTAVLDIFFIQTWAAGITELLSPYLGWLPFS